MRLFKVMVVALCIAVVSATAGQYEDGVAAMQRGDYAAATRLLVPLANQGDARAQFSLSQLPGFQTSRTLSSPYSSPSSSPSNSSSGFVAAAMLFAAVALVALVCIGIAAGARKAQAQLATSTSASGRSSTSSASLFGRRPNLRRKEFWIWIAGLVPAKWVLGSLMFYLATTKTTTGPLGAIDMGIAVAIAIAIGARFNDIGWPRWLGVLLPMVFMLGLPVIMLVAVLMSQALPRGTNPVDVFSYLTWPSAIGMLVLIVVAGSKPSANDGAEPAVIKA
jgi:hypothetical protein